MGLNVSGIKGALAQGLTRAQHSAMDVRKSLVGVAIGDNSRRGSWREKEQRGANQIFATPSDDVGCLSDFVGTEEGDENNLLFGGPPGWNQPPSNEGIQIVVQEHIENTWDATRLPEDSDVKGIQNPSRTTLSPQSRRGELLILTNQSTNYKGCK